MMNPDPKLPTASPRDHSVAERLRSAAISVLVTVVFFGAVEAITRAHHYYRWGDLPAFEARHLVDFARFYRVNPSFRSVNIRVNDAGFRNDEEISIEKPENVLRVVTMGGSTVWGDDAGAPLDGIMIDNDHTIAAHLEEVLNARAAARAPGWRVQVINAGVVGYLLYQNETYFNQRVAAFQPDVVVALDGHNDLDALQIGTPPYHHRNEAAFDRAANRPTSVDVLATFMGYLGDRSLFVRKVYAIVENSTNVRAVQGDRWKSLFERPLTDAEVEAWLDTYSATVRRFDASARIVGARAFFAVQPEAVAERYKIISSEEQVIRDYYSYYASLHTVVRDRLIERMDDLSTHDGIWFEDVSDAFAGDAGRAYLDYTHLSDHGAELMARRIADVIEDEVFARTVERGDTSQPR